MTDNNSTFTLITGASQGIGKALANECAMKKMNLFLVALSNSGLQEMAGELAAKYGIKVEFLETDLTMQDCHLTVYEAIHSRNLKINTLINNVGIGWNGQFGKMSPLEIDQMFMLNLRVTTLLTRIFMDDLYQFPRSYILNICSMASFVPLPGKCIYSATKAYVMFFSKALQVELKGSGISVTSVFPYGVMTNERVRERISQSGLLARKTVMTPEKIAGISIDGMLKGKKMIIPGNFGKMIFYSGYLIPQGLVLDIMKREIRKAPH